MRQAPSSPCAQRARVTPMKSPLPDAPAAPAAPEPSAGRGAEPPQDASSNNVSPRQAPRAVQQRNAPSPRDARTAVHAGHPCVNAAIRAHSADHQGGRALDGAHAQAVARHHDERRSRLASRLQPRAAAAARLARGAGPADPDGRFSSVRAHRRRDRRARAGRGPRHARAAGAALRRCRLLRQRARRHRPGPGHAARRSARRARQPRPPRPHPRDRGQRSWRQRPGDP